MEDLVIKMIELTAYKNKKVFITGHTGFKGGWLVAMLHTLGAEIKGYALAPEYSEGIYSVINGDLLCKSVIHDIRNKIQLEKEINEFEPDFIFHLAAQPLVRRSYKFPSETYEVNVMGTCNLLDACMKLKNKCTVVIITTDKVYQNMEGAMMYNEESLLGGFDPYSSSKACVEVLTTSYRNSFFNKDNSGHGISVVTARAGNVIGGGDFAEDRLLPDMIKAFRKNEKLILRNPDSVRPWQHVLEPLSGYLTLGLCIDKEPGRYGTSYNFGPEPNDHLTVLELANKAVEIWSNDLPGIDFKNEPLHETGILQLDITKAKKDLDWRPKYNSEKSIQKTIEWYNSSNQRDLSFEQINSYMKD